MYSKTCFKCHQTKPISEFYSHPETSDGRLNKCKSCTKSENLKNRAQKREQYSAYERLRNLNPLRKASKHAIEMTHRLENPIKYKARTAVNNAIRDGRLVRQPCEVCGSTKVQAHHDDYSKPFEVRWLCFKHHREVAHGQVVVV